MTTHVRSPNYPSLSLSEAIHRLQQLYPRVQRGEFTPNDAASAWDYRNVSGPVRRQVAALGHYGLLELPRGGNARISNRGLTIILRAAESREYRDALRDAGLSPVLFRELYDAQRHTAADDALRQYLVVERRFSREGAEQFIVVFRATMALAGLTEDGIIAGQHEVAIDEPEEEDMPPPPPPAPEGSITIPVPFAQNKVGTVILPLHMTNADWVRLDKILTAYRPDTTPTAPPDATTGTDNGANAAP